MNSRILIFTSYLTPDKNAMLTDPFVIADSSKNFDRTDVPIVML